MYINLSLSTQVGHPVLQVKAARCCQQVPDRMTITISRFRSLPKRPGHFPTFLYRLNRARRVVLVSAWYHKQRPTFADTVAAVRRDVWREQGFFTFMRAADMRKLRPTHRNAITYALC